MLSLFLNWSESLIHFNNFKYASDAFKKQITTLENGW